MEDKSFQEILNKFASGGNNGISFSPSEIRSFRKKYLVRISSSAERLIVFDLIYKWIVATAYACLIFLADFAPLNTAISIVAILTLLLFSQQNNSLRAQVRKLDGSADITSSLKNKYDFFIRIRREFLPAASLSHSYFVLAGFQYYMYFKYGGINLESLFHDPVIYIFLVIAYLVPLLVQRHQFTAEIGELKQLIDAEFPDQPGNVNLNLIQRRRRFRQFVFILLLLAGVTALYFILHSMI
jgi:hypothetical protein